MLFRQYKVVAFISLFSLTLWQSHYVHAVEKPATASPHEIWEKIDETDGIKVYRSEAPNSDLLKFKGEGTVDAPLALVASVIFDAARAPEWMPDLVSSKIVRWVSENEFVEYDHIGTPFIIKDRDFVSLVKLEVQPSEKKVIFRYKSFEDPATPLTDYVRGDLMNTTFVLKSIENGAKTHIEGEIHADPKGNVPKWVANFFQKSWPVDTFKGLRAQLRKLDIQENSRFKVILSGSSPREILFVKN